MKDNRPPDSRKTSVPGDREMFVGLNILSRIGVIFIILGVIAFSAVSDGYVPGWGRMTMIVGLGAVMLFLGELFRRHGSAVFAGALTIGGTAELFLTCLIGRLAFGFDGDLMLPIGAATAAAGLILSKRYDSQGLLIVTLLFSLMPAVVVGSTMGYLASGLMLMLVHCGAALISHRCGMNAVPFVGVLTVFYQSLFLASASHGLNDHMPFDCASVVYASAFVVLTAAVYSGGAVLNSLDRDRIAGTDAAAVAVHQAAAMLLPASFLGTKSLILAGVLEIILAAADGAVIVGLRFWRRKRSSVDALFENLLLTAVSMAVLLIFPGLLACMIFHAFAAAVTIVGAIRARRLIYGWGCGALIFAELLFLANSSFRSGEPGFVWVYALNCAIWLVVMAVLAACGKRSALFRAYSVTALLNAGFFGVYLVMSRLGEAMMIHGAARSAFSNVVCAAVWLVLGFTAGKLKFLGKAAVGSSVTMYAFGMLCLLLSNIFTRAGGPVLPSGNPLPMVIYVIVNAISVLCVLDMSLLIQSAAPKFGRAVGLVVSFYALMAVTVVLDSAQWLPFTSCVISILYMLTAAVWIVVGFVRLNALLRRFGLALALFSSAKLFLTDFSGLGAMGRTLMFIGFGITLLAVSFTYGYFERRVGGRRNR